MQPPIPLSPRHQPILWPTILDCIEHGLHGDSDRVRSYAQLLLEKLPPDGLEAKYLQKILNGENSGRLIGIPEDNMQLPGLRSKVLADQLREQIADEIRHDGKLYKYFGKAEVFVEGGPGATGPGYFVIAAADGEAVGEVQVNSAEQWEQERTRILAEIDQEDAADEAEADAQYAQVVYEQGQYPEDYAASTEPNQPVFDQHFVVPPEDLP